MPAPTHGNPPQREVIIMFEPHRLEHHLLQSAYGMLVRKSTKRLPGNKAIMPTNQQIEPDPGKTEGAK